MLAQDNENKEEVAVYYLSKRMTGYELNYSSVEKVCWALAWVMKRLRHYMQAHPIKLVSRLDPIRFLFQRTLLSPRLAKWMMMISKYGITYTMQKSIKRSIVADFLDDQPITIDDDDEEMVFPDDEIMNVQSEAWKLMFDGALGKQGYDIGILLIDPAGTYNPTSVKLSYSVTNNEAEYEACIAGIKLASEKRINRFEVIGDSNLVISQANGDCQVKDDNLKPYHSFLMRLIAKFESIVFIHDPRSQNRFDDALKTLAAMTQIPEGIKIKPLKIQQRCNRIYEKLVVANTNSYIENGEYPAHFQKKERRALRQFATSYVVVAGYLYRRSFDGQNILCVDQTESTTIMEEVHAENCGSHMNGMGLAKKHTPASLLYNITSPWPFSTWGIDIIGKIYPHASNDHEFILVAIDYFTKWVEASSFKILKSSHVAKFIRNNIISGYGVPHSMISDNGRQFQGNVLELLREFKIEHHKSSPYRPQTNGAIDAANKNVISILKKTTQTYRDWHEKLPYAMWGYRTTARTSTGETPYSLGYGMEAVQPIELELPTLRVLLESHVIEEDWLKSRYDQLSLMEDRRLDALCKTQAYQQHMARAFNKKVKPRHLVVGDLVLRKTRELQDPRRKFQPPWEGPFIIKQIFSGGAVRLATLDVGKAIVFFIVVQQRKAMLWSALAAGVAIVFIASIHWRKPLIQSALAVGEVFTCELSHEENSHEIDCEKDGSCQSIVESEHDKTLSSQNSYVRHEDCCMAHTSGFFTCEWAKREKINEEHCQIEASVLYTDAIYTSESDCSWGYCFGRQEVILVCIRVSGDSMDGHGKICLDLEIIRRLDDVRLIRCFEEQLIFFFARMSFSWILMASCSGKEAEIRRVGRTVAMSSSSEDWSQA
ncbi:uncharacterized protein LOC124935113 [Impatiens glandulifera]|uniref:uncharacterized protein LOC124935113 n=1 Tax=Impatiens glandulifera TaxID=253017 RepID=UPI001FB18662|nr:uncharacterized protein LOC124935113 [Impatiens glandulifera]